MPLAPRELPASFGGGRSPPSRDTRSTRAALHALARAGAAIPRAPAPQALRVEQTRRSVQPPRLRRVLPWARPTGPGRDRWGTRRLAASGAGQEPDRRARCRPRRVARVLDALSGPE